VPAMTHWRPSQRYRIPGGEVAYEIFGAGPPVVLIHGMPSWSYLWRNVAGDLAVQHTGGAVESRQATFGGEAAGSVARRQVR
jgi:pimeloyl-ACP methyl ester carboxylesterase